MKLHKFSIKPVMMLSVIFIILLTINSNPANAVSNFNDNNVDADSNVDSSTNLGDDGSTSYTDAQAVGANDQEIVESNTSTGTYITDLVDNDSSDVDSSPDFGTLSNFANSQSLDSNYATFTEELGSDNSADLTSNEYFLVGSGGSTSFNSTTGTIEMWLKFDVSIFGRPWGQNGDFEIRNGGGAFQLDFGPTGLTGQKSDWIVGKWYFIAVTWDETDDDLYLYWGDESTIPVIDNSNTAWTETVSSLSNLGNRIFNAWGGNQPIDGRLDEFRYWNTERTLIQIQSDYNTVLTGNEVGLQNYYQFENSLTDLAGSADLVPAGVGSYTYRTDTSTRITNGYQIDQEVQFTNLIDFMEINKVNIFAGTTGLENIGVSYWNGSSWSQLFTDLSPNSWNNISVSLANSTFTLKFSSPYSASDNTQDSWNIDIILFTHQEDGYFEHYIDQESNVDSKVDVGTESSFINLQATDTVVNILTESVVTTEYELEQEIQFTNIIAQPLPLVTLAIKTGNLDVEALKVQYWDGGQWVQITTSLTSNSWNNFTVTSLILSTTFTIRFVDGNKVTDSSTQSVWEIDSAILVQISKTTQYDLDWEHQSQSIDTTKEFYELTIYGSSSDNSEDFQIQLWNQTSSSWTNPFVSRITNNLQWYNYSIPSGGIIGSSISWRYTGTLDGEQNLYDLNQNTLFIDYAGIASWEEIPVITSNPADISNYEEGNTPYSLSWTATDSNATSYTIYRNGAVDNSGSWTSGLAVNRNINGLLKGVYNYTIVFTDISGNTISDEVVVTVSDVTNPTITNPANFAYEAGNTSNWINWTANDNYDDYYRIFRNNSLQTGDLIWTSGISIDYNVDGLLPGIYNYTIAVFDKSNNSIIDTVIVTVSDTTNPTIVDPIPSDTLFEAGSAGNIITWNTTDVLPDTYTIYRNGTQMDTGTWISGVTINFTFNNSLTPGNYNFTIIVFDTTGNNITNTVIITIIDITDPTINSPADTQFTLGTTGNQVDWIATDVHSGTYIIYKNGTQVDTNTWASGVNITYDLDNELKGTYEFLITVFDTSGNSVNDTVIVVVIDTSAPSVTDAADIPNYVEGNTNYNISWTTIDSDPDTLTIYRDGVVLVTIGWTNNSDTRINIDGLSKGTYNYTIIVYDTSGNYATDTVMVTVNDLTDPVINTPSDFKYPVGSTGNVIEWIGTDIHPDTYIVLRNGSQIVGPNSWVDSGTIRINIDGLAEKVYNFTIIISDTTGNQKTNTVFVEVTAEPVITNIPNNLFYILDDTGNSLNWTIADSNPDSYILYREGVEINSSIWKNGIPLSFNVDGLSIGVYNFTIQINDTDNNIVFSQVNVTVSDMPIFSEIPPDITNYIEGNTGYSLTWNFTDLAPDTYTIYNNSVEVETNTWNNATNVVLNIDGLAKGSYNFTIIIYDLTGNYNTSTVWVTVLDETAPSIDTPIDITFSEGDIGPTISWTPIDLYENNYTIYQNGTPIVVNQLWTNASGISLDLDTLSLANGYYNFTVYVGDISGNTISDTVWVNVTDDTPPSINTPSDITFTEGNTGPIISWTPIDLYENKYTIYQNGTPITVDQPWNNTDGISLDLDTYSLAKGYYNFTVYVEDISGNTISDTVWVNVTDDTPPSIDTPSDITFTEGNTGSIISWTPIDLYENNYTIYQNGTPIKVDQPWNNTDGISLDLDILSLAKGYHNFTVYVEDISGNTIFDTVWVNVTDDTTPSIIAAQSDITNYIEGTSGNTLSWEVSDLYPENYEIYRNLTLLIDADVWSNGVNISVSINGLPKGFYNFTLYIYDKSGNLVSHVVWVTVIDTDDPILTTMPPDNIIFAEGTNGNILTWVATDLYDKTYVIYENGSQVDSGTWANGNPINFNVDYLVKGLYNISIIIYDESGNFIADWLLVTVSDDTRPLIISPPSDIQYEEGDATTYSIIWIASDKYNDSYVIYKNTIFVTSGTWNTGIITIPVDGLLLGVYSFDFVLNDTSGNIVIDNVIVTVVETNRPVIISASSNFTYSGDETGNTVNWTFTDAYPDYYEVTRNGLLVDSGPWNNNSVISVNVDGLIRGQFIFTITVYDSSGNFTSDSVQVDVIDTTDPIPFYERPPFIIESGTKGQFINWTVIDSYPGVYEILHEGTLVFLRGWASNQTNVYPIDDLLDDFLGDHNFTIINKDQSGNQYVILITVKVEDTTIPQFTTEQGDVAYAEGSAPTTLTWVSTDVNDNTYTIYQNGSEVVSGSWTSGSPVTLTPNLPRGVYGYMIVVFDDAGNSNSSTLVIVVSDETAPNFISEPSDDTYEEGTTGHKLSWTMTDNYPDTYEIYKDNELLSSIGSTWFGNSAVEINTDGLSTGEYNYTMVVFDESGNRQSSTVIITVIDVTNPEIILEAGLTEYVEGTSGNELVWNVIDVHPGIYNLSRNGELISSNTWISGQDLSINIDGLEAGEYVFIVFFADLSNNNASQTTTFQVNDETAPIILGIATPDGNTVELGEEKYIEWTASDLHPTTYSVKQGRKAYVPSGIWSNTDVIRIKIESTTVGFYNYTIVIRDESGNIVIDWVIIRVKDPEITDTVRPELKITRFVYEGDLEDINGTWTDVDGNPIANAAITARLYEGAKKVRTITTNTAEDGSYILVLDYWGRSDEPITPGNYTWKIEFAKDDYQPWADIELDVTILFHRYKVILDVPNDLIQGEKYFIAAIVSYENLEPTINGSLSLSDVTGRNKTGVANVDVTFTIIVRTTEGGESTFLKSSTTDSFGVAIITLTPENTENLVSIVSIQAEIAKSDGALHVLKAFDSTELPEVQEGDPTVLDDVLKFLSDNITLVPILAVLIAVSVFLYGLYNKRKRDKIREINNSVKSAHIELQAIQSIQSIIMQTSSKLTIYEEQMAEGELNSTLISGMVTAFSSFLGEIGKNELFGFEMMEREGVSITLHKGEVSNIIIISSEKLPLIVLSQIRDAQMMIESEFKTNFTNTTRGVTKLTRDKIHPLFHKASFKIDLQDQLVFNESNIRKLLKQKSLSRALKANISLLYEFPKSDYFKDGSYKLNDLIRFYQSQAITERVSSRTIILAYQFDVINSERNK